MYSYYPRYKVLKLIIFAGLINFQVCGNGTIVNFIITVVIFIITVIIFIIAVVNFIITGVIFNTMVIIFNPKKKGIFRFPYICPKIHNFKVFSVYSTFE